MIKTFKIVKITKDPSSINGVNEEIFEGTIGRLNALFCGRLIVGNTFNPNIKCSYKTAKGIVGGLNKTAYECMDYFTEYKLLAQMNLDFKFDLTRNQCDKFTKKVADKIVFALNNLRPVIQLGFAEFGEITFDEEDEKHYKPHFTSGEFNRTRTNAILFNVAKHNLNIRGYNKLVVYQNASQNSLMPQLGYVLINTDTGEQHNHYCIDYDITDIIRSFNTDILYFNSLKKHHLA